MRTTSVVCCHLVVFMMLSTTAISQASTAITNPANLAVVAASTAARNSGSVGFGLNGINDGLIMTNTGNFRNNNARPPRTMHWIQYEWKQPINTKEIGLYWWDFNGNIRLPDSYHIKYWDGNNFVDVKNPSGFGLVNNQLN